MDGLRYLDVQNPAPDTREEVALSGIVDVLSWRHALELSPDPNHLRSGRRIMVDPKFLDKLGAIIETGEIGLDPVQSRWLAYEAIFVQYLTWPEESRPVMLPEGDPRLSQWSISAAQAAKWMEDAKRIAVAGYRQVLEDGPDVSNDEPDAEYGDHGEELEGMYTKSATLASARISTMQANALRPQPREQSVQEPERRTAFLGKER
jgi:hypothetical protein